ncbi:MAG: Tad secretion system pilus assembly protein RcpC [Rhodobacteraceae bacterium HLUCCA09]|nr:MAG: Tad secretion system pilus assembly protein RcpC [Rhodobacteraceae bacterium HLUCCA09]
MRLVFALVLVVGVGLAGFAVYMAQGFIDGMRAEVQRLEAEKAKMPEMTRIAVFTEPRAYGETLDRDSVKLIAWQADSVPEGAFTEVDALFPGDEDPRFILRSVETFEPVLASKVTEPGQEAGLTSRLGRGMRAFAIRVDVASGVSGFLRPGDRVDVYWTGNGDSRSDLSREITKLIETNVRIIAIDQMADSDRTGPVVARTVTVEATPQEVASLAQAQSTGRLSLSLVGAEDTLEAEVVEVNQNDLLGIMEVVPEIIEQERVCTTKIRRGAEVIEQEIPCTN